MSNLEPQHHKDINELLKEKEAKEHKEKLDKELQRQKDIVNNDLLPFLYTSDRSITAAKMLINNTLKTLNDLYGEKMKEEQMRLSDTTIADLDIPERLERDEKLQMQASLIDKVKGEKIGTATGLLNALHVAIAGHEAKENSERMLKDLKVEL